MKNILKMLAISFLLSLCFSTTAFAKPNNLTEKNFDYEWYLEQHPDLAALIPADNHSAIWLFYINTGEPAGWYGRQSQLSYYTKENFDYDYFMANNPDVVTALGTDPNTLFNWYITMGYDAKRPARTVSDYLNATIKAYDLAEQLTTKEMTNRQKAKAVHDWLCINVAYDNDNYLKGTLPSHSYSVEGTLLYNKAVCDGYAKTFKLFMDIMGIDCERIIGKATNSVGHTGGHAWNKVFIDNQWLYVDVTWDDPIPDKPGIVARYDYFLISESQMNRNHTPNEFVY